MMKIIIEISKDEHTSRNQAIEQAIKIEKVMDLLGFNVLDSDDNNDGCITVYTEKASPKPLATNVAVAYSKSGEVFVNDRS